jgi:hypothetical protein
MSDRYEYCKVFVARMSNDHAKAVITALLDEPFARNSIELPELAVDVRTNPDSLPPPDIGDDFVRWPLLVELERTAGTGGAAMVDTTSRILEALWAAGGSAVAACDFEDELPHAGGIRRMP